MLLFEFLLKHRPVILESLRQRATSDSSLVPIHQEALDGLPVFFDYLVDQMKRESTCESANKQLGTMETAAGVFGKSLQERGFTMAQLVHRYGDICQIVTHLAHEESETISSKDFQTFNGCLDRGIAEATSVFQQTREGRLQHTNLEQTGKLAHELKNCLAVISMAFEAIKVDAASPTGEMGRLLDRNLANLHALIDRNLTMVRLDREDFALGPIDVFDVISDVEAMVFTLAGQRKVRFHVKFEALGVKVLGDWQLILSALSNVVQNAIKYTKLGGNVWLSVLEEKGNVLFEVKDECGGLPPRLAEDNAAELFKASVRGRSDRTGMGLGLTVVADTLRFMHGSIRVQNIQGHGCIFTLIIPVSA